MNTIPLSPMDYYFYRRQLYTIQYVFEYAGRLDFAAFGENIHKTVEKFAAVGARMKFLSKREIVLVPGSRVLVTTAIRPEELAVDSPEDAELLVHPVKNAAGEPLLKVHVTSTPSRTFIGFSFSHMLGDGKSTFHFLSALSSICCGGIASEPSNRREMLHMGSGIYTKDDLFEATGYTYPKPETPAKLVLETIRYTHVQLEMLQEDFLRLRIRVSRNDIIMADLAKRFHSHIPLYRGKFIIRCPVDYRKILGLPEEYFGNAIRDAVAVFDPDELMEMSPVKVALRIRQAILQVNRESARQSLQCLNAVREQEGFEIFEDVGCPGLIVTNWSQFPIAKMDFGIGRPVSFYHTSVNPRLAIILPTQEGQEVRFKRPELAH